jgi:hypothetical protein
MRSPLAPRSRQADKPSGIPKRRQLSTRAAGQHDYAREGELEIRRALWATCVDDLKHRSTFLGVWAPPPRFDCPARLDRAGAFFVGM